jgi:acetyl-CoA synthetase
LKTAFFPSEATVKAPASPAWRATTPCAPKPRKILKAFGPSWRVKTWLEQALHQTLDESNAPFYKWFDDGELNASANCLDKHMGTPTRTRPPSSLKPMTAR